MEEKRTKLSFSVLPSKPAPPKPAACPAAFFAAAGPDLSPAPRFVTTFDPTQALTPPAAPSSAGYGLAVRDTEQSNRRRLAAPVDAAAAAARRFRQDMAVLPDCDINGADEYEEVPVEGFGAALLAGYGWKEGHPLGKSKGDPKIVERGRRSGTQGLGAGPSDKSDSTVKPVGRRSVRDLRVACLGTD